MHSRALATHKSPPSKNEGESTLMDCIDPRTSACTNSDDLLRPGGTREAKVTAGAQHGSVPKM
jgi:hypothetical protein